MPVSVGSELVKLSQEEFAKVAFTVMGEIFELHRELGRLFDESVYQKALMVRMDGLQSEVRIDVTHRDFCKSYYMDVVASSGGVFELKTTERINDRCRVQLLNYLLLTELNHGKIVNLRPRKVEHEFVNTTLTHADRIAFQIEDSSWKATAGFGVAEKSLTCVLLQDWGTSLARALYEEALVHFLGGAENVVAEIDACLDHIPIAKQRVTLCAERVAFKLTTFETKIGEYRRALASHLNCMALDAIQWVNISRNQLTFQTLSRQKDSRQ